MEEAESPPPPPRPSVAKAKQGPVWIGLNARGEKQWVGYLNGV